MFGFFLLGIKVSIPAYLRSNFVAQQYDKYRNPIRTGNIIYAHAKRKKATLSFV